jgi:hypothetical protein
MRGVKPGRRVIYNEHSKSRTEIGHDSPSIRVNDTDALSRLEVDSTSASACSHPLPAGAFDACGFSGVRLAALDVRAGVQEGGDDLGAVPLAYFAERGPPLVVLGVGVCEGGSERRLDGAMSGFNGGRT